MINDQDKRAIETMARCGCEFDSLCSMFPIGAYSNANKQYNYVYTDKNMPLGRASAFLN